MGYFAKRQAFANSGQRWTSVSKNTACETIFKSASVLCRDVKKKKKNLRCCKRNEVLHQLSSGWDKQQHRVEGGKQIWGQTWDMRRPTLLFCGSSCCSAQLTTLWGLQAAALEPRGLFSPSQRAPCNFDVSGFELAQERVQFSRLHTLRQLGGISTGGLCCLCARLFNKLYSSSCI